MGDWEDDQSYVNSLKETPWIPPKSSDNGFLCSNGCEFWSENLVLKKLLDVRRFTKSTLNIPRIQDGFPFPIFTLDMEKVAWCNVTLWVRYIWEGDQK